MTNLEKAHKRSFRNKEEVQASEQVGCFYCRRVYTPDEIEEWVDRDSNTAICPHCHIDSVIGDKSGFPVTDEKFLTDMHERWFGR